MTVIFVGYYKLSLSYFTRFSIRCQYVPYLSSAFCFILKNSAAKACHGVAEIPWKAVAQVGALAALSFTGCGEEEDPNAPVEVELHDSIADVKQLTDGKAKLMVQSMITNNSELKTLDYSSLSYDERRGGNYHL